MAACRRVLFLLPTRRSSDLELAAKIKKIFQETPGVVDVDWYVEDPQNKYDMKVDLDVPIDVHYTGRDRKSTRLNSSHLGRSYSVFYLNKTRNFYEGCFPFW